MPLTCQPLGFAPLIPIFHIIGTVTQNASLPGGLEFEHINDVNGIFLYKGERVRGWYVLCTRPCWCCCIRIIISRRPVYAADVVPTPDN